MNPTDKLYTATDLAQAAETAAAEALVRAANTRINIAGNYPAEWTSADALRYEIKQLVPATFLADWERERREAVEHLNWAFSKIEFPLGQFKDEYGPVEWKVCPGCRVLWKREMEHKPDCPYTRALDFIDKRKG